MNQDLLGLPDKWTGRLRPRKVTKCAIVPEAITTDGLRSYKAAMKELGNADKQEIGRWANNPVENSH